jgi:ribosomal-protein-alanine N-acetyltransferase
VTFAIRDMAERDVPALDALLRAAYETSHSLEARLRAGLTSGAARTFVADDAGGPVGMATLHDYGPIGYVALVGVAPSQQGCGIGRSLMEALIADSERRGHRALALESSDEGQHLYRTLGFRELGPTLTFEGTCPAAASAARGVRRARSEDRDAVCACDRRAFGGDRSATIDQWFALSGCTILVAPGGADISGYAVVRDRRMAPLIAQTPAAAADLFAGAQAVLAGETARVSMPAENGAGLELLTQHGWRERFRNAHMVRGTPLRFPRSGIYGLISLGEG